MRSMRTTGYQATNLGLAIEEVLANATSLFRLLIDPAGQQDAALAAERRAGDGAGKGR
jgi:hypothetical protein